MVSARFFWKHLTVSLNGINFFQDNITEGEVLVDPKHHKHFVARRGEVLRRISDDYGGVLISFPRQGKTINSRFIHH